MPGLVRDAGWRVAWSLARVPRQLPPGSFTPGVSPVWKLVTSGGSTGRPKLIAATTPALLENVGGLGALIRMRPGGCVLVTGPISHNAPFVVTAGAMLLGNHVVVMSRFDPAETLRLIDEQGDLAVAGADHDASHLASARGGPAGR